MIGLQAGYNKARSKEKGEKKEPVLIGRPRGYIGQGRGGGRKGTLEMEDGEDTNA